MKGFMTIKVTEHGYGIDCDFVDVGPMDKVEFMHAVSCALEMDKAERALYFMADSSGVMDNAASQKYCTSEEELAQMLQGGKK